MASRLKSIVKTLKSKARAKAPAREHYSDAERSAVAILYAASIGDKVDPETLANARRLIPETVAVPYEVSERLRIIPGMDAREAASRYAEFIGRTPSA